MRKHQEDQKATNHDNRSLTPQLKQFKCDEMGTTRKGRSHLCFITHPLSPMPQIEVEIRESPKMTPVQTEHGIAFHHIRIFFQIEPC